MKKRLLTASILAAAGFAHADYQFEVGALYGTGDIENIDYDAFGVAGNMYFDRVNTGKGPLAEASFLSKASGVSFAYTSVDLDFPNADDIDTFGLGGRVVTRDNLILELDYAETDSGNSDADSVRIGVGTYLSDSTDVVVSFSQDNEDIGPDADSLNIRLHGVGPLQQGASLGYDLSASYVDTDDDDGYDISAGATYYPSKILGLGLEAEIADVAGIDTNTVTASISYFPAANVQLAASWYDQGGDIDSDGLMLGAALRF